MKEETLRRNAEWEIPPSTHTHACCHIAVTFSVYLNVCVCCLAGRSDTFSNGRSASERGERGSVWMQVCECVRVCVTCVAHVKAQSSADAVPQCET